ncbi:MAG: hypothetical protein IPM76_10955 [Chloroflexi bacterium]|nr:hypothetical protein [Chloroflexota bacterium]
MNAILPVNAREYFFFDGEKIDNFSKPEASAQVKDAIYLVLKLEMLERSRRHLENTATNYRKELKQASGGELRELLEQDETLRQEREKAIKRKDELEKEKESAQRKVSEIDQKLGFTNAKALQQQRDRLEKDLKQRRIELMDVVEQIRDRATSSYPVLAQTAVQTALTILNEKKRTG